MSGETVNIQSFGIKGDTVDACGSESIQIVGSDGNNTAQYFWYTMDGIGLEDGWYNDSMEKVDVELKPGDAFILYLGNGNAEITFSGGVELSSTPYSGGQGINVTGNCSPVDINIQDLKLSGDTVDACGSESIQIVGSDGNNTAQYFWYTINGIGLEDGWYNDAMEKVDVTIPAGTGFLLYSGNGAAVLTIPAPM